MTKIEWIKELLDGRIGYYNGYYYKYRMGRFLVMTKPKGGPGTKAIDINDIFTNSTGFKIIDIELNKIKKSKDLRTVVYGREPLFADTIIVDNTEVAITVNSKGEQVNVVFPPVREFDYSDWMDLPRYVKEK